MATPEAGDLESIAAAALVLDSTGRIVWWNKACSALCGLTLDDVRDRPFAEAVLGPGQRGAFEQLLARILGEVESARAELSLVARSGAVHDVLWSCARMPVEPGQPPRVALIGIDISERRQEEEKLRHSEQMLRHREERFRAIFNNAFQFIGLLSLDGTVLEVNRSGLELAGIERQEVIGRPFHECSWWSLSRETQVRLRAAIGEAAIGRFVRFEVEALCKDGGAATIDFSVRPVIDDDRVLMLLAEGRDITDRKRVEDGLRESEARFAGIISISQDAIITVDVHQRIQMFSEGAEAVFGYSRVEVLGAPLEILLPERFRSAHREDVERFGEGEVRARPMGRNRIVYGRRKSGEEFPAEASISKLGDGARRVYTVVLRDVTDQRRVEREQRFLSAAGALLAESLDHQATLRKIAQLAVPDLADSCVIYLRERGGSIDPVTIWHADPELVGVERELIRRQQVSIAADVGVGNVIRSGRSELHAGTSGERAEPFGHNPEHRELLDRLAIRSYVCVPLRSKREVLGAILLLTCGASTRRLGPRDLMLAEELARRSALAIENARLYRAAQEASHARDMVMGVVAHDLRTPLSSISLAAQLFARSALGKMEGKQRRHLEVITSGVQRMARLVDDLLMVAKFEAGQLTIRLGAQHPEQLIRAASEEARSLTRQHDVQLEIEPGLPFVSADRDRIGQVLGNLIGNAQKFTPPGGSIRIGARRQGHHVTFWVADTGPGIAEEHLPHLFDAFWQADSSDCRGAGLGLAISKVIIEAHGGTIWVESKVNVGTRFCFTLPTARHAEAGEPELDPLREIPTPS